MSGQIKLFSDSLIAGEDLRTHQYKFVKISAARTVALCGSGERPYGILQNKPNTDEAAEVMVLGVSNLIASGVVAYGSTCGSDSAGKATAVTNDRAFYGAIAREAGAVDGDIISVFIIGGGAARSNA